MIKQDALFEAANFTQYGSDARFAIRRFDGKGDVGEVFFGDPEIFTRSPVTTLVQLPDGEWIMAAIPSNGWSSHYNQDNILLGVMIIGGSIISALIALFAAAILRIRANAHQLNSIFNSMTSVVIELKIEGVITWIAPTKKMISQPVKALKVGDTLQELEIPGGNPNLSGISQCNH